MEDTSNLAVNLLQTSISTELSTIGDHGQKPERLRPADMWVLCLFTFVPAAATILYSIYQCFHPTSNQNERSMNILPVTLSLIASFLSANTIVGLPATITKEGLTFGWIIFTFPISMFLVSYFFVPLTYNLKVVDVFVYLELRFSHVMQKVGAFMFCTLQVIYLSIVLRGPGIIFEELSGFPEVESIVLVGVVCSLYTALGGMKAGIYIEAFQSITMFLGLLVVVITTYTTSSKNVLQAAMANQNETLFFQTEDSSKYSVQSVLIGATVLYTAIYAVNQSQVQRYAACTSLKKAQISLWLTSPGLIIVIILCCLLGLQMLAHNIESEDMDKAVGKFLMEKIDMDGVVGLFVAGIFSATMSSFSCGLSATNKVFSQNLLPKFNLSHRKTEIVHSVIAFLIGSLCTGIATQLPQGILRASLFIYGSLCCPILGVVILGIFFPWTNKNAVYLAIGITVPFIVVYYFIQQNVENWPAINILWYGPITVTMVIIIGILGSKAMGFQDPSTISCNLLSPFILKILNKSPKYQKNISQEQARMWNDDKESTV